MTGKRAWLAIIQRVLSAPADLVIVGKRTEVVEDGPLVGSVAAKLLRKCPCAVWAVKPGSQPPPRTLLAATDLSPVGDRVLERAAQLCERADAALHVVHSFQLTMAAQLEADQEGYIERTAKEARRSIHDNLVRLGCEREPRIHVGLTSPSRAIKECVERYRPDLVVMATVSRGGIAGFLIGNTAERMLQRLDTSLFAVKPADFVCPVDPPEESDR
jgi:nucleotide-binding universal stress UspA family protein